MAVDCTSLQVLIMVTLHVINAVSNLFLCFLDRFVRWPPKGYHARAVCPYLLLFVLCIDLVCVLCIDLA